MQPCAADLGKRKHNIGRQMPLNLLMHLARSFNQYIGENTQS